MKWQFWRHSASEGEEWIIEHSEGDPAVDERSGMTVLSKAPPLTLGFEQPVSKVEPMPNNTKTDVLKEPSPLPAPRASFRGLVSIVKSGHEIVGDAINISATGIYMATDTNALEVGEVLSVAVAPRGIGRRFKSTAKVVRRAGNGETQGFGLQFV